MQFFKRLLILFTLIISLNTVKVFSDKRSSNRVPLGAKSKENESSVESNTTEADKFYQDISHQTQAIRFKPSNKTLNKIAEKLEEEKKNLHIVKPKK